MSVIARIYVTHIAILTAEKVELGRTVLKKGMLNAGRYFWGDNIVPINIQMEKEGLAVETAFIDGSGNRRLSAPFGPGPIRVKVGQVLQFPIGGLRFRPKSGDDHDLRIVVP